MMKQETLLTAYVSFPIIPFCVVPRRDRDLQSEDGEDDEKEVTEEVKEIRDAERKT